MPRIIFEEKSGARRPLVIELDLIVLPGVHDMTDEAWEKTQNAFGAKGYIARGELYDEEHPPAREKRKPTSAQGEAVTATPKDAEAGDAVNSADEIKEYCRQISAMKVEDAEQYIVGLDVKPALVALIAKDNRQAIKDMAVARLEFLNGSNGSSA